jgi:hypothetical protein
MTGIFHTYQMSLFQIGINSPMKFLKSFSVIGEREWVDEDLSVRSHDIGPVIEFAYIDTDEILVHKKWVPFCFCECDAPQALDTTQKCP